MQACRLRDVYCSNRRHVYYPCSMPVHYESPSFDPSNLNLRTKESYERDILLVEGGHQRKENIKKTGINMEFFK